MSRNRFILYSAIVALGFLWTGSSYISQMYRLQGFFSPGQVDVIALRWNYLAQAGGVALYAFLLWRRPRTVSKRSFFMCIMFLDAVSVVLTLTSSHAALVLGAGLAMNLLHGAVAAAYLTLLGAFLPKEQRGRGFGFAYAAGSLGTYLLSLLAGGRLIKSAHAVPTYLILIAANVLAVRFSEDLPGGAARAKPHGSGVAYGGPIRGVVLVLLPALVLMAVVSSVGSDYQFQAVTEQGVNLELSRAFYAVGLVVAGAATDRDRRLGAVFCFVSLVFPFAQVAMRGHTSLIAFTWGLSYFVLGFYSVYRAVAFVDIAGKSAHLLPLAGVGLGAGRVGEALSTLLPRALLGNPMHGTLIVLTLFVPLTFLFFFSLQRTYGEESESPDARDEEVLFRRFLDRFDLTKREGEIFRLLHVGLSNSEIAGTLYISESTVKFHVKNILKKTGCPNRNKVIAMFRQLDGSP